MAMDCLAWPDNGTAQLVLEGFVKLTQPGELLLTATKSRGRTLKWQNIWMALVVQTTKVTHAHNVIRHSQNNTPVTLNCRVKSSSSAIRYRRRRKRPA